MLQLALSTSEFYCVCVVFEEVTLDIITEEVALACVWETNGMTEYMKRNVYISVDTEAVWIVSKIEQ